MIVILENSEAENIREINIPIEWPSLSNSAWKVAL